MGERRWFAFNCAWDASSDEAGAPDKAHSDWWKPVTEGRFLIMPARSIKTYSSASNSLVKDLHPSNTQNVSLTCDSQEVTVLHEW